MPYVQTPNLRIHYRVAGDGDITLVLLHGNFGSWRWWEPVLERLPSGYRAYAPDLRGCGDSARPGFGHNIEVLTSDVFDFITSLSLCDVHLVGHSLGGAVALQAARDHPDLVRSLLLIAPPPAEGRSVVRNGDSFSHWVSRLFDTNREAAVVTLGATYRLLRHLGAHRRLQRLAGRRGVERLEQGQGARCVAIAQQAHSCQQTPQHKLARVERARRLIWHGRYERLQHACYVGGSPFGQQPARHRYGLYVFQRLVVCPSSVV